MIRQATVAGLFYPEKRTELEHQLAEFMPSVTERLRATAVVLPHAGYIYSGSVAGEVVAQIEVPKRVILLGPNHQGNGHAVAVTGAATWQTPLGSVPIASELRDLLLQRLPGLVVDERPHEREHSLEVLLPFLQYQQPDLEIVPIALGHQLGLDDCKALAEALSSVIRDLPDELLLVASSDMNHFLPAEQNARVDALAIKAMTDFDPRELYEVVVENRISMCGVLPVVTAMYAASGLGAQQCRLIRYAHSGQVGGDNNRVVGYAGMIIE